MEPPAFSPSGLCTVRAAPGSDATLVLPVPTGSPPFNYQWSRAGASLDERFTAAEDAAGVRLTVTSANTGDTNVYTLQASNEAGSDTSRVRLEVCADEAPTGEDPPTFLRRLQDLTVKVGTRTRFLVEIISSTECKVTWFRNERRLLEAERVALARDGNFWCADVAAVSVDDAGRWTCTAENAGGRASCSAHLNVLVPKAYKRPEFMEELRALLTEQGTVSLECKVVGVPTPVLRWFKDSREIKAGDVFALTANAEDPTSLGTYTCEAVNCMGRAYSSSKVHVVGRGSREGSARPTSSSVTPEPPPIFTKELEDQFVRICEPLTLGCHIVVPPWPRSVIWYNKEGKIEPSERYHVLEDGAGGYLLEVPSAEWPDEGEWKCVATSTGGRVGISTCYVTMDVPKNYRKPRFMENLQAVLTEEGLVSFECKVVGFPTPVLSWFKDGQELKPGDVYQLTGTNSLGSYCCIARNCMGQASSSAELTVEDIQNQLNEEEKLQLFSKNQAPKFIQGLKSVEAKIDESFRFTVKVAIPPEPSVLWYRDDQPVDESSRCHHGREDRGVFYLDIQSLEFLDQAEWKCVAMNDFGHSVTSCFLKLIIPRHYKKPRFLENLQAILSDEGAVNLECKVIGVPQPVLKWYKDGEELKPGDIHRIISGQDGTCCLGTYTCEAQNCMGIAASSASLLGFDDSMKAKKKKAEEQALQRNLSLSTIHEERTSQMYDTPVGDVTTLDDKGEISFSFDGKEVSVSLYETPDLTEEEALQIVEMYADQLSENITEHNVVELPPLRFVKETSTSGNLLMEAVIIDVSPEYFVSPDEDMRTEADIEDISIADENGPPQLSLDQDIDIGGEDYLEKTMAMLSEEKSDISLKFGRKKSDSQRSADDFYSLSREHSLSEEKRDDDTQAISDLQSFASAHSLGKPKSKSSKPSGEDGQESSEPSKTILHKDEALKHSLDAESLPVVKPKRERRTSRSSRRSSSGSEKSVTRSREEVLRKKESFEMEMPKKTKITDVEFKEKITDISTSLSKVINDVQIIERDIILKSELMSSAATASRSLEIISSLISPLSEIHSIADAAKESVSESKEVSSTLFNSLPQPLKSLQQSLTIIEKCIDMESDSKTLVKKTCVAFIETCGSEIQKLISNINSITSKDYLLTEDRVLTEIESLNNEMSTVIKFSADTIKARNLLNEANEIKVDEPSVEVKHIRDTQKAVFELKSPLMSLLCIAESADSGKIIDIAKVRNSEVILNDMSGSIQDLQTALEQIETLSVKESNMSLHKYNTEIIETVMESVVKLRSSFEQLSKESEGEDKDILNQAVTSIKENLNIISSQIEVFEKNVGTFDVLQSENKLDALQKMAQILIALENNLPRLDTIPEVKNHMTVFHKNLTKVLENVIESNESKKYFTLMEICDAVNRINASIKNLDADNVLPLASLNNTLRIIQDQFITNVFDSELNCSVLTNIADTLLGIQEAINTADEVSTQIDSEHIKDITPHVYDETKAKVVVEHIDHTIAAIENVKAVESTQDIKLSLTPALENIRPVLEELRRTVASIKSSGAEEEHVSDLSEISSFAKTFASPLWDLNQNIIVLNQNIVENIESLKENCEIMATIAQPLHELHTTLEILQQDVISQYGEDLTPYDVSVTMASAVQNLQSCIVLIQEQAGMEATEEMSTLEDISGIKTTADTLPSDRLVLPTAEETAVEQTISPFNQELQTTATAQALQTLNEHITVLQTTDIIDALDSLSEISDYSSLKSFVIGLGELHSGIEEVLHPLLIEGSNELGNLINPSKLTAIAEPMQELQQSLSVLDTSNIPIYENLLEMPTERIHSVIQTVSEFKEHLDKCMFAVFPALHTADNTEEIANKVGALREVCEHLKDIIETTKAVENVSIPEEVKALERTVNNLLDVTDVSKGIKIEQVKSITEELYQKVATVQDEMIQFTPHAPEKLAQEAKLIQTIDLVQSNIAVLQQYDFVDLSRVSDLTCTSPQMAIEIESDSLMLMEDIVDSAVNVVQDSSQNMPIADLMIVEDFFKTCKNEFTILRCLISKATTHKKIIRLLQEFSYLQSTINDFKTKRFELSLSDDISGCLTTFLIHAEDCLQNVQTSLLKIVDSQADLLIEAPLAKFENSAKVLKAAKETKHDEYIIETVNKFVEILETAKPTLQNVQADILDEIKSTRTHVVEDSKLVNMIEEFATFVEVVKNQNKDVVTKDILEKVSKCIEKHHDFRDASGTGKTLILLKCLSDCTDVLQESLLEVKIPKRKVEEGPLKAVLTEMLEPLQALHSQLTNIQDQVLKGIDEDSISVDISTTESLVHMMTEKHNEMIERMETEEAIANEEISLIIEVDKEIHSIQDSLRSMESVQVAQVVKEIAKPVENIEKSMHNILSSEKLSVYSDDKLPKEKAKQIIQHIDQYIDLIEIVEEISAIIKIDNIEETVDIAKELRESIAASEITIEEEMSQARVTEVREEQTRLARKLQTALTAMRVQVFENAQELAPELSTEILQRIAKVTAQLQADLVAVTGVRVALQAPAETLLEIANTVETLEGHAASVTATELSTVASGSEAIILEQVGFVEQLLSPKQLLTTTDMLEKAIVETKEVITSEHAQVLSTEIQMESIQGKTNEAIAIEGTEAVFVEQTESVSAETTSTEYANFSIVVTDQAQEVASVHTLKTESISAVVVEDLGPVLHEVTVDEKQVDVGISQTAKLQDAPQATIDLLIQHIDQFISDDITEIISELSHVINAEELKQSINIAKELRENIAASEVELKAETSDVLKHKVEKQQAKLLQQLYTALTALDTLPLDSLGEIPSINKDNVQRVAEITENLRLDLITVAAKQNVIEQVESTTSQLKPLEFEVGEQIELPAHDSAEVQEESIKAELENLLETNQHSRNQAQLEAVEISTTGAEKLKASTLDTQPSSTEEVTVSGVKTVITEQTLQKSEDQFKIAKTGHGLIEHIDEFISDEISELVNEVAVLTNSEELKESIKLAKVLKESIEFSAISEESSIREVAKLEQAKLIQMLQGALSILHPRALEMVEGISPIAKPEALQRVAEIISQLQKDLETAFVSGMPDVLKAADIVQIPEVEGNTMKQLKVLLQEVTDKVNLPTERNAEDTEALRNVLDEVQTVIIKLKRDYDGAAYDTLNETLEDLECSVRSVQLQINEDSPPELLKEACATLQLLVNNMRETQEIRVAETTAVEVKNENILEKCSIETDETVKLLELASKTNIKDSNLAGIVSSLNILTETIKTLKLSFMSNADVLIEKGVDVVQSLNQLEDKVFMLEKDLAEVSLHTEMRDHILTAVHSVYGSISNMRGTISSIQKRYMFENYGKPSETLLRSIKNISAILEIDDAEVLKWKVFSKSLRKVLNHFEDIKFFINLDKTARLPSDAAFTKIILDELKSNICEILVPQSSILGEEAIEKVNKLLQCVNKSLNNIEAKSTLEVKEKIPVFKELSSQIFGVTDFIKAKMSEISKETKPKVIKEELDSSKLQNIPNIEQELVEDTASFNTQEIASINTGLKENVILLERLDDIGKTIKESPSTSQVAKEETSDTQVKERKQVIIQEIEIESEIEKIASELINNIAAKAIAIVQNLEGTDIFEQTELFPEKISQCIEPVQENIEESPITIEDPKLFESINEENKPQPSFEGTVYTTEEPIVADNSQAVDIKPELEPEVESTEKQVKNTSIPDTQTENVSSKVEKSKEKEQKEKEETEEFSDDQIKELVQELPMQEIKVPEEARISVEQKQIDVEDYEVHETKPIHAVTKKNTTNEVSDLAADMLEEGEKDKKPTKKTDKQHSISNEEPAEIEEAEKWEDSLTDVKDQFSEPSTSKITAKHGEDTSFQDISTEEIDKDKLEKELLQEQQQQGIITDTLDEHQQKQVEKKILEEDNLGDVQKIEESQGTEQETKQVIAQVSVKQTNNNDVDLKGIETTGDQEKQSIQQTEPQAFKEQETLIHNEKAEDLKVESQESQKEETCIPKELISIDVLESKKKEHEDLEKIKPKLKEQKILVPEEEFDLVEEEKDSKENKLKKKRNEEESTSKVVKFAKEIPKEDLKVKAETQEWEEKVEEDKQKCDKIKQNDKAEQNEEESKAKILIQAKKTVDAVKEESIKTEIDNAEAKMEDDKAQLQKGGEITKNSSNLLKVEKNRIENEKEADMAETLKKCTEDEDKSKSVFEVKQKETGKTEQKGIQFENKQSEIEEQDKKLLEVTEKTVTLKEEVLVEAKNIGLQIEKQDSKNTEESEKKTKEIEHKEIAKFEAVRAEQLDIEKDVTEKKNQLKERKENEDAEKVHDEKKKEDEEEKARLQAERILYEQKLNLKEEAEKARLETEKKMSEAEKQNKEIEVEKKRVEEEEIKMKENEKAQAAKNKKDEEEKARFEVERVLGEEKLEKDRIEAEREKKLKELQEKARLETENKIKEEAEKLKQEAEIKIIEEKEIAEKKNLEEEKARLEVERVLSEEKLEKERIEAEQEKKLKGEEEKARLETEKNIKEEAEKLKQEAENKILEEKEIAKKKKEEEEKARLETEKKIKEEADKLKQEAKNKILEEKEIAKKKEEKAKFEGEQKLNEAAENLEKERVELEKETIRKGEESKKLKEEKEKARLESEKKSNEDHIMLEQETKEEEDEEKDRLETVKQQNDDAKKIEKEVLEPEQKHLEEEQRVIKVKEESKKSNVMKKKLSEEEKAKLETEKETNNEADRLKKEQIELEKKKKQEDEEEKARLETVNQQNNEAEKLEKDRTEAEKKRLEKEESEIKEKEKSKKKKVTKKKTKEEEDAKSETAKKIHDEAKGLKKEHIELEQKTKQEEDEEKAGLETVKQQNNEAEMLEKEQVEAENKSFIIEEREMKEKDESKQKKKLMKSKEEAEEIKLKAEKKQKEDAEQLEKVQFEAEKKQKERAEKSQLETEMKLNKEAAQHDKEINESENKQLEKEAEKRKLEMEQFKAQNLQLVVEERDEKVKENTEKKKLIKQNKIQEKNQSKEKGEGKIVESQILEEKVKVDVEQKGESHDDYQKDKTVFKQKKNEKDSNEIGKQGTVTKHEEEIELKQKEEFNLAILTKHKEEEEARLKKESLDKQRSKDFRKEQQDSETQQTEEGSLKTEEDVVRADKLEKSKNRKDEEENSQINSEIKRKQEQDAKFKKEKQEVEIRETEELNKKKVQEEQRIKQENEVKLEKEKKDAAKLDKEKLEIEKQLKSEEKLRKEEKSKKEAEKKLKQEKEAIATKQKKDDEKKHTDEEKRVKELQEAKEKEDKLKQEEAYRLEKEKKKAEKLEKEKQEEKLHEEEERARQEKKRVIKKKREEEESRFKAELEAEKARKDAARKRKDTEKTRLLKEQEQAEARETEIRETEKRIREERRREIENDLIETKKKPKLGVEIDTLTELTLRFDANGNSEIRTLEDDHYIREYQYEPTRGKSDDRTKFVDQNHKDYTMEFLRPSGYRERGFEHEKYSERETLGKNATIYKAQTIILDSQLRSSAPPQSERSQSEIRMDRYDRGDSEKRVERHRSKALSEVRSMISEKRSGLSRDSKRKPVFSTYLTDRTAVEGSRVKLTCSVLSSTDPRITWYKNGVFLDDKLKYRTKFIDGLITLEVLNAVVSDSAEYSCTVENENGSVNTSANLKVYPSFEASPIPPTFTRSIRDTFHLAENELVLECRIRGQPLPTITWLKDDKPVSGNERYQAYYLADGVCRLAISSPTPEDSGKYTCKAENSVWSDQITHIVSFTGKETRLNQNITTIERSRFNRQALESRRPHFTNVLSDYKVAKGGTIGLQVEIKGCPTRVEWLQEGRNVTEVYRNARTFVEQGLYTLALSDVTEKESGMYTCRAWSTHGNVDMNAAITVVQPNELEGKPAIIVGRPEKDILISVGEDVNISFRVQGEPKPKVVFMKGIRDITTNQRVCKMTSDDYVKFTLKRSVVSDAGTYCILARNAYGCDRAFVTVVVRQRASSENLISDWTYPMDDSTLSIAERKYKSVPDRIPGEPSVVDGGNNWVSLAWPKADPRDTAPVLAYKIESWLLGKEGGARWVELGITPLNSFDAFNLKQGEEYHFRVTPRNRYGWGESVPTSIPIGIGLAGDRPEFVEILPGQLKVLAGEKANLSCSIKGKPVPEIVWMKNGHEIEEESRMTTLYNGQDCSLTIKDICIEDEARYSCEASNVHGRASTYARLAVVTDRLIWEADAKLKRERSQDAEGDYPPQFTMRLRDRRVQATYPVRLTCQVVGNPPPTITWFKDGELLVFDSRRNKYQDEHFHTLEIAPTSLEDGGVYEAMARNSSGAVSCRCSLVVDKGIRAYVAPEFCCGLEPLYRLSEGEELRISAVVEAYPSVGVTWYRDGVRLRPSRRAIMTLDRDGQIELALAAVTARDAGVYTCTASNEVGRASTSGKVDIIGGKEPLEKRTPPVLINAPDVPYSKEPMFVRKPRSSEAREGDTVIIACEVIGDPKPDVYWLRDFLKPDYYRDASHFKRVGDGPEYRFEIPHAKLDYTGAYSVVARNIHGEAKAIISLQILAKDPSSTDDSHNVRYGRVEVIPRFDRELTDLLSYDGDAVEFECHVTGNPEPDIRWFHYNELIRDCPDFESSFDEGAARLKIKQVTAEDEGTYSCEASNNLGKATSSACLVVYPPGEPNTLSQRLRRPPALLSAASTPRSTPRSTPARSVSRTPGPDTRRLCSPSRQMAPSFYTYPFNKVVEEGDHVTFKCAVKGQPSPWATWDKDGIIITPSARFTIREKDELLRILEIEQVTIEDVGIYRITVENEFGRAEAAARLEVITQKGKFYGGVRAYSPSPRKSLTYRRYPSVPRQD